MPSYIGNGEILISGSASYKKIEPYLLSFASFSKNREYEAGLDENNKYPEDYAENYSDIFNS